MGYRTPTTPFTAKERGVSNRLTHDPSPADLLASDESGARAVLERHNAFRSDPPSLIQLAEELHRKFLQAGPKAPLTTRAAATELLRIYGKLKEFESSNTPRGPGGRLQYKNPISGQLQPWTRRHPRVVAEIPPFPSQNVRDWEAAAKAPGPPLPALAPPKIASPRTKPKPVTPKASDRFEMQIIKLPGMTLKTKLGQTQVLAAVIRLMARQEISDAAASAIASKLDFSKYWVLDFEDTVEHATKVFESYNPGSPYTVKLKNEFFQEVKKATAVPLTTKPRLTKSIGNDFSFEFFPDFTNVERLWYVLERVKQSPSRDRDSGHKPGEIVSSDMVMFVGSGIFGSRYSLYWAPDGRIYAVPQKSLRDQQLDALIQGFVDARGGVILGVAIVIVGATAIVAPEVIAAFATAVGPVFSTGAGLYEAIMASRFAFWMGLHWEAALAAGLATVALTIKLVNFDPVAWVKEFRENPKKAVEDLVYSIAETIHDYLQLRQSLQTGSPQPAPDPDLVPAAPTAPIQLPSTSKPAGIAVPVVTGLTEPDVSVPIQVPSASKPATPDVAGSQDQGFWRNTAATTPNRLANRPPADRPISNLTDRRNQMTNPSTATAADQLADAVEVQPVRVLQRTGTGGVDIADDDQTTGIATFAVAGPRKPPSSKSTVGFVKGSKDTRKAPPSKGKPSDTRKVTGSDNRNTQDRGVPPMKKIDLSKAGAFKKLAGTDSQEVADVLHDVGAVYAVYAASQKTGRKAQQAAADIRDLAQVVAEHTTTTPGGIVKTNPAISKAIWALPENLRGILIERVLGATKYKGWSNVGQLDRGYFPDIDFVVPRWSPGQQQRVSVKTVNPYAKAYEKQLSETLPAHLETLVSGTDRYVQQGLRPPSITLDVQMPQGATVPRGALARTLRELVPKHLQQYITIVVEEL